MLKINHAFKSKIRITSITATDNIILTSGVSDTHD